ncbi:MAG: tail fiber domain-containing protein [Bacteriovoracaceae bacterium]|nr:tail fiber domain-containing protein [Bacteriovoracaceae bacterium]
MLYNFANHIFRNSAGSTEYMRINSSGNVGIGTSTPNAKLAIGGEIFGSGSQNGTTGVYLFRDMAAATSGSTSYGLRYTDRVSTDNNHKISLVTQGSDRLIIDSTGNVGIGTSIASSKLHVQDGSVTIKGTNSTLTVKNGGGTPNPLSVNSVASFDNETPGGVAINIFAASSNPAKIFFGNTASPNQGYINYLIYSPTPVNQYMSFGVNSAERMRIDSTGNVGIGTTSPQTTLQVAGVISPSVDNTHTLGNATYRFTTVYATTGTINTSDAREKKEIKDSNLGLDFVNKLRPVSYKWKNGADNDVYYGLIAQETENVLKDKKLTKTSIVSYDKKADKFGVRYSELIAPLIKAVQELYNKFTGHDEALVVQGSQIASKADKVEMDALKTKLQIAEKENAMIKAYLCSKDPKAVFCK